MSELTVLTISALLMIGVEGADYYVQGPSWTYQSEEPANYFADCDAWFQDLGAPNRIDQSDGRYMVTIERPNPDGRMRVVGYEFTGSRILGDGLGWQSMRYKTELSMASICAGMTAEDLLSLVPAGAQLFQSVSDLELHLGVIR